MWGSSFELLEIRSNACILRSKTSRKVVLKIHGKVDSWTLMGIIGRDAERTAIFENHQDKNGSILYVDSKGIVAGLSKSLEPITAPQKSYYLGRTLREVLESDEDLLGEVILSHEDDPSYKKVAQCLPPMRIIKEDGMTSFVGSRGCLDKPGVFYGAYTSCFRPKSAIPEFKETEKGELWEGLVGGWLPILRYVFYIGKRESWEVLIFADPSPVTMWIQPVWFRIVKVTDGHVREAHYYNSYLPFPPREKPSSREFYLKILELYEDWRMVMKPSMKIEIPEERIVNFCNHALIREMITRIGDWPKYGVFNRNYGGSEHDGFQDTLNSGVNAMLEWGLFDIARRYIENYFSYFVHDDGSIEYRGPEIGQYGRHLTIIGKYYNYTKDHTVLLKYHIKIRSITKLLLSLRKEARKIPKEDPTHGMIRGWSEADSCLRPNAQTYNLPYFSNSAEVARGFHDLGKAWIAIGKKLSRQDLIKEGEELLKEAEDLRKDLYNSINRSILENLVPPHLPGIAGAKEPYDKVSKDDPWGANVINGRCYCEMLHSGCLSRTMVETIIRYQSKHGGRLLGLPRVGKSRILGFLTCGYGYGMLQHDLIREFLFLYYAHMAHIYTRGTWTATECADIDRSKYSKPYCSPAQLVIPVLTKWMLVFEDPWTPTVWLMRGVPRSWLQDGKIIRVNGAPTTWGFISCRLSSNLKQGRVVVELDLPDEGFNAEISLRLRVPKKQKIQHVIIDGKPSALFDPAQETVMIPKGSKGRTIIEVFYQPSK